MLRVHQVRDGRLEEPVEAHAQARARTPRAAPTRVVLIKRVGALFVFECVYNAGRLSVVGPYQPSPAPYRPPIGTQHHHLEGKHPINQSIYYMEQNITFLFTCYPAPPFPRP